MNIQKWVRSIKKPNFSKLTNASRRKKILVIILGFGLLVIIITVIFLVHSKQNHDRYIAYQKEQASKLDDKKITLAVNDLLLKREYSQALSLIDKQAKYPTDKAVLILKGNVLQAQGNLKGAVQIYQQINKQYGTTTDALLNLGQLELRLGEKQQALADYKLAAAKLQATPTLDAQSSLKNVQAIIKGLE